MNRKTFRKRLMVCLFSLALLPLASVYADSPLISSQEALALERTGSVEQLQTWFQRDDVAAELMALGVDPAQVDARVAALSPAELDAMAQHLDELPAGAGVLEVLGATFLVLIVLDLLGILNIFGL